MDARHQVPLGGGWATWAMFVLRSAGFPAALVTSISSNALAEATDRFLHAHALALAVRSRVESELSTRLANQRGKARGLTIRALKAVERGEIPRCEGELERTAILDELVAANAAAVEARAAMEAEFENAQARELDGLVNVAQLTLFREALTWQNRASLGVLETLGHGRGRPINARAAQHRRMVASYLQRYSVKNDAAGFYGPTVWARIDPSHSEIQIRPGASLVDARNVYFEYWGIDLLAQQVAADDALKPHLAPRRLPTIRVHETTLHYPIERSAELDASVAQMLSRCDGVHSALELAAQCELQLDDALEILEHLETYGLVTWTIELPTASARPEAELRAILERAGGAGEAGLAKLSELEVALAVVERAAGDPDAVDRALLELDATFERITTADARRSAGQMYAGRTLVFLSCRRAVEVTLGSDFVQRLAPAIVKVLTSARWYAATVAAGYRRLLDKIYEELGGERIDFLRFWKELAPHFPNGRDRAPIFDDTRSEVQNKWAEILGWHEATGPIDVHSRDIEDRVAAAFGGNGETWPAAKYQSIDVMIAARNAEAVIRGDYTVVLGELHCAVDNTANVADRDIHPDPTWPVSARERDLPAPSVNVVRAKDQAKFGGQLPTSTHDFDLELGTAKSWRARDRVLEIAMLEVERDDTGLFARHRSTNERFEILTLMQDFLLAEEETLGGLNLLPARPRMPRVTLDGVVLSRRQWRLVKEDLEFASVERGPAQYASARRWATDLGVPRWFFVKVPHETKPMFIDLESPIFVELLTKLARSATSMNVSEMLPAIDEAWLPDEKRNSYTSEFRILALR